MEDTRSTLLVRLADHSDEEAWQTFDELYRPLLVSYTRSRGLTPEDAVEITQECVAAVVENIHRYQHVGSFKAWLRTIAENKIHDLHESRHRERKALSRLTDRQVDKHPGTEELWERRWLMEHLIYCVEKVRPQIAEHTYQAFVQNVLEEQPAKEVAASLGMSLNQVYVAKFRVLERIRGMLRDLTGSDLVTTIP